MVVLDVRLRKVAGALLAAVTMMSLSGCGEQKGPPSCQDTLKHVTQLIVVLTDTMDSADAQIAVITRDAATPAHPWQVQSAPYAGVVGRAGLGWGVGFEGLRQAGEVVKREGDKRSPAGLYPVGQTFGFQDAPWPGHITLKPDDHVCVDDLNSVHYGHIVSRQVAGADTSAEDMAAISVYKRGIVVVYPPNAVQKSGSCIFFHIWQGAGEGTAGCIASDEARIAELQNMTGAVKSGSAKTAALIWAKSAKARLDRCIPGLPSSVFETAETKQMSQDTQ